MVPTCAVNNDFDYLSGKGKFNDLSNLADWKTVLPNFYSTFTIVDNNYLQLTKKPSAPEEAVAGKTEKDYAKGFFDDAYIYQWPDFIKPRHIHFEVQATKTDVETCGVHFYSI